MTAATQPGYPVDLRAPGALEQLLAAHRSVFGDLRMEGDGEGDNGGENGGQGGDGGQGGNGGGQQPLTLEQVVSDLGLTPEQIAGRLEASKKWERRATSSDRVDRADYQKVVEERDKLKQQHETEQEKAVREAHEKGASEARAQGSNAAAEAVLRIALRSASKDISDDELNEAVSLTNLSALVAENGSIDEKKVLAAAGRYAGTAGGGTNSGRPDMGQGNRGERHATAGQAGNAEADRRFGQKKA